MDFRADAAAGDGHDLCRLAVEPPRFRAGAVPGGKPRFGGVSGRYTNLELASLFILSTGQPVLTLGGYSGWDRILPPDAQAAMVRNGIVRFFYLPSTSVRADPDGSLDATADLSRWVSATARSCQAQCGVRARLPQTAACSCISAAEPTRSWGSAARTGSPGAGSGIQVLP